MKKTLLLVTVLLALSATAALAAGVNLAWGTICYTEAAAGAEATTFACNTNAAAGGRYFTCSFVQDVEMADMVGVEWRVNGVTDGTAFPDYWKLGVAPDCRAGKAIFNSKIYVGVSSDVCVDWTNGAGFDAPNYLWTDTPWTGTTHGYSTITCGTAIDASTPFDCLPGQEYYAGGMQMLNSKAVGTGSCAGCATGMLFVLENVTTAGIGGARIDIGGPLANQCIKWNNSVQSCAAPTPARNTTWGQVKSLYR